MKPKKVMFIGPLPDPVTGQSLACKVFLTALRRSYSVDVVDIGKRSFHNGIDSLFRCWQVMAFLLRIARGVRRADCIYFTIAESFWGNLKDILIMAVCWPKLSKTALHLHGGAGMRLILRRSPWPISRLNSYFFSRVGAIIALGDSLADMFSEVARAERIKVVPNFAEEFLFVDDQCIREKFSQVNPLRVLFLSNHLEGKGHVELLDAFASMDPERRALVRLDFAGGFRDDEAKREFHFRLALFPNASHHGIVGGQRKRELLSAAHVFCLPTYYAYEGQPISILEAYASGCAVVTTGHSGIGDIFCGGKNGLLVESRSPQSIKDALEAALAAPERLLEMALFNRSLAHEQYRTSRYTADLLGVVGGLTGDDERLGQDRAPVSHRSPLKPRARE